MPGDPADRALTGKEPEEASQWRKRNIQHGQERGKEYSWENRLFFSRNYGETQTVTSGQPTR